jgi:hypothetical protein
MQRLAGSTLEAPDSPPDQDATGCSGCTSRFIVVVMANTFAKKGRVAQRDNPSQEGAKAAEPLELMTRPNDMRPLPQNPVQSEQNPGDSLAADKAAEEIQKVCAALSAEIEDLNKEIQQLREKKVAHNKRADGQ